MTTRKQARKPRFITDIASIYYAEERKNFPFAKKRKRARQMAKSVN
ncbi:MAG: hypothetical protein ACFFCQ_12055 [Promethearchaeota archaeon]